MRKVLIATHGKMASGVKYTAELILGEMAEITTIDAYVDPEADVEKQMEAFFAAAPAGEQVFVFTDLQGGSVNQKLLKYTENPDVMLITGFNLALLVQMLMTEERVGREEVLEMLEEARQEMQIMSLANENPEEKPEKNEEKEERYAENKYSYSDSQASVAALRVDDRLIHGQVAMTWTRQLKVQGIIVANDEAAADQTQKMALQMAAPGGVRVLIKPVNEVIRVLNRPEAAKMRILVLTKTVADAVKVRENVGAVEFLNVGNAGRFDGVDMAEKKMISSTIMLTETETEALKKLAALDPGACLQQVPNDERRLVTDVIEKMGL